MKPSLFDVTGKNGFCGPTAISTVLGIDTDHAAIVVRSISGQAAVKAMSTSSMILALRKLGCDARLVTPSFDEHPTVSQWIKANASVFASQHVIVVAGRHFGVLLGRRYLCSLTHRQTVALNDLPKPGARVESLIVVSKLPATSPQAPARAVNTVILTEGAAKRRASVLAKKWNIAVEREFEDGSIWVYPPKSLDCTVDPFEDSHGCDNWNQALIQVDAYAKLLKLMPSLSVDREPAQIQNTL